MHPLAQLAVSENGWARETACDAAILKALDAQPGHYGRLLLALGLTRMPQHPLPRNPLHYDPPPITLERMLGEASSAQVIYRSEAVHPRHQANFRVFEPLDFLAEVSAHIPDPACRQAGARIAGADAPVCPVCPG